MSQVENWSDFDFVCAQVIAYASNGDPIKDVLEKTPYNETEFILELVRHYMPPASVEPIKPIDGGLYWVRINDAMPFIAEYSTENKDRQDRKTGAAWWHYGQVLEVITNDKYVLTVIQHLPMVE